MNLTLFERYLTNIYVRTTEIEKSFTEIESHLIEFEISLTLIEDNLTQIEMNLTDIGSHLTEIDKYLTNIDGYSTLLDENKKPLAITFVSTFTIFPVLTHNPIVKELTKPPLFCLPGNLVIPSKN